MIGLQVQSIRLLLLGLAFGIGRAGVWLLSGMGTATFGFLIIAALPCPILGFGIGGNVLVDSLWSV